MREIDIIDVTAPDQTMTIVDFGEAWADLATVVGLRYGIDINGQHPFNIVVKPLSRTNRRAGCIVAYPKTCATPEQFFASGCIAYFGELTAEMATDAQNAQPGSRALWARPIAMPGGAVGRMPISARTQDASQSFGRAS